MTLREINGKTWRTPLTTVPLQTVRTARLKRTHYRGMYYHEGVGGYEFYRTRQWLPVTMLQRINMDQAKIDQETAEIARLEALSTKDMTPLEELQHRVAISDAYWRRRMAMRTDEEVARGVIAPGR